jgi:hypothetical protein
MINRATKSTGCSHSRTKARACSHHHSDEQGQTQASHGWPLAKPRLPGQGSATCQASRHRPPIVLPQNSSPANSNKPRDSKTKQRAKGHLRHTSAQAPPHGPSPRASRTLAPTPTASSSHDRATQAPQNRSAAAPQAHESPACQVRLSPLTPGTSSFKPLLLQRISQPEIRPTRTGPSHQPKTRLKGAT